MMLLLVFVLLHLKTSALPQISRSPIEAITPKNGSAFGYITPRAFVDKVDPRLCGDRPVDVSCSEERLRSFSRASGKEAATAFCDFLHAEKGGIFLNQIYNFQAHTVNTQSGIFDLEATCEQCLRGHNLDFNFVVQKNYEDCRASYEDLIGKCCKSDTECYGGNRYSELGVRYMIRRRQSFFELPPHRSSDWIFIGVPSSKFDMKAETAKKAIDKFCAAGPERLARTQRHSSTGIAGFADEFKGYVVEAQALSESENPHSYCSKGVLDSFSKTCSAAFYAILGRARSPGRGDYSPGGALRLACGDWKIYIRPSNVP